MHFKCDADASVRSFLQRVFLLYELVQLHARTLLGCQVKHNVAIGSIWANDFDFQEFHNWFDHDSDGVACIATHFSQQLFFVFGKDRVVDFCHQSRL